MAAWVTGGKRLMHWFLILVVAGGSGAGVPPSADPFTDQMSCRSAAAELTHGIEVTQPGSGAVWKCELRHNKKRGR